jgi:hypothetical protein
MTSTRHKWGEPSRVPNAIALPRKTERQCIKCRLVKVTWHEIEGTRETYRTEFWRELERVESEKTPVCADSEALGT